MKASRAVLIGLDGATLDLVDQYAGEGALPNLKRLMEEGVAAEALCALPPATSVNWNTVSTGAYAGTHGVVSMAMIDPRGRLDEYRSGFSSDLCLAEHLWDAAERAGKRSILLKYTTSWPPSIRRGVQVEGFADPDWSMFAISPKTVYTNELGYSGPPPASDLRRFGATKALLKHCATPYQVRFRPAEGWKNLLGSRSPPLETELPLAPIDGEAKTAFAAALDSEGKGYDTLVISPVRDAAEAWGVIHVGEFSPWITEAFRTGRGEAEGTFRFKLYRLSPDASEIRLYRTIIFPAESWTYPGSLASELTREIGPFHSIAGIPLPGQWIGYPEAAEYYADEFGYQGEWLARAAHYLMSRYDWDLFATQFHAIDLIDHFFFPYLDPANPRHGWGAPMVRRGYELSDRYVGEILDETGEETFTVVVSDHGYIETRPGTVNVNQLLADHGLLRYEEGEAGPGGRPPQPARARRIDWSRTKAFESGNFVWVNLKGRQPNGIVEPGEYEALRDEIVRILESAPPATSPGDRFAHVVVKKEDAEAFGLWGDRVGDVVYFHKAWYHGGHHGNFHTTRGRFGSMRAMAIFKGPGVRRGERLKKPINLVDVAPTIAHAISIPTPRDADGRVLHELWE